MKLRICNSNIRVPTPYCNFKKVDFNTYLHVVSDAGSKLLFKLRVE